MFLKGYPKKKKTRAKNALKSVLRKTENIREINKQGISKKQLMKYVLQNNQQKYLSEYLMGKLILTHSITEAMVFADQHTALGFKKYIKKQTKQEFFVQSFIE